MTNYYEQLKAWKWLQGQLQAIPDPSVRKLYHDTFILKAIQDWGFNPEHPDKIVADVKNKTILDDFEKRLDNRIKVWLEYGIDVDKNSEQQKEARANMYEFIKGGGTLTDLPEELRKSEYITDLYFSTLKKVYDV